MTARRQLQESAPTFEKYMSWKNRDKNSEKKMGIHFLSEVVPAPTVVVSSTPFLRPTVKSRDYELQFSKLA